MKVQMLYKVTNEIQKRFVNYFGDSIISLYPPSVFSYFNNGVFQGAGGRIKYSNLICSEIVCIDVILQVSAKVEGGPMCQKSCVRIS